MFRLDVVCPEGIELKRKVPITISFTNQSENILYNIQLVIKKKADKIALTPLKWEYRSDDRPANDKYTPYSLYYYTIGDLLPSKKIDKLVEMDTWIRGFTGIYELSVSANAYIDQEKEKKISTNWVGLKLLIRPERTDKAPKVSHDLNTISILRSKRILKVHPVDLPPRNMSEPWIYNGLQDLTRIEFRQSKGYKIGFMVWYRNSQDQSSNVFISIRQFDSSRHSQVWYRWIEGMWWKNHRETEDMGIMVLNGMPRTFFKQEKNISYAWRYGRTFFTLNSTGEHCEKNAKLFLDILDMVNPSPNV